ncbi:MAG: DnaJ domain-containing protein [Firmicutes bacterium]|nr:DnaJ domain-containing protein [Bacillota bacterium]
MNSTKPSRRRSRRPKIENYYKILGTNASASQETIKRKYIELVKAYPPETHPEEFQRIRRAFETLRDPVKRSEYDLMRKYGNRIEKIMDEALECMEEEQWEKASALLRQAMKIAPGSVPTYLALAMAALKLDDRETFDEQFRLAGELVAEEEKVSILLLKAKFLLENDLAEEALELLDNTRKMYPKHHERLRDMYMMAYDILGRYQELWDLAQSAIPSPEAQKPEDIHNYVNLINIMADLEKWGYWSNIQTRMRRFLKSITDPEDKLMVLSFLKDEHDVSFESGFFRLAFIFIDFIHYVDSRNLEIKEQYRETQDLARIEKEIMRIKNDENMFPLIFIYAFEWFYRDYLMPETLSYLRDNMPPNFLEELEEMDEEFAAGIVRLRKKYPLVYRCFQKQWDEIFKEKTAQLNREARRHLR